jgi:hypothetical protein
MLLSQGIVVSSLMNIHVYQQEVALPLISQCMTPTLGPGTVRRKEMNVKRKKSPTVSLSTPCAASCCQR